MFENYDIQMITKTVNVITNIDEESFEHSTTHNNEGIIEIRIFDTEQDYQLVKAQPFEQPILQEEEAIKFIRDTIKEYESNN